MSERHESVRILRRKSRGDTMTRVMWKRKPVRDIPVVCVSLCNWVHLFRLRGQTGRAETDCCSPHVWGHWCSGTSSEWLPPCPLWPLWHGQTAVPVRRGRGEENMRPTHTSYTAIWKSTTREKDSAGKWTLDLHSKTNLLCSEYE